MLTLLMTLFIGLGSVESAFPAPHDGSSVFSLPFAALNPRSPVEEAGLKLLLLLEEKEPALYQALMEQAGDVTRGTKSLREAQQDMAMAMQTIFGQYLPYADEAALLDFTRHFFAMATALGSRSPDSCRSYVLGEGMGELLEDLSSPPAIMIESNSRALVRILETADKNRPIPTTEEAAPLFEKILTPSPFFTQRHISLVTDPGDPRTPSADVCESFLLFYRTILALPAAEAADVLRYRYFHISGEETASTELPQDLRLSTDRTKIVLSGYIKTGTARRFSELLRLNPTVRDVYANADLGGLVGEARAMRDEIRSLGLTTRVTKECTSACTIMFLGGKERYLYPGGKLGFHRYTVPGFPPSETKDEEQDLITFGVSAEFTARVMATPPEDMWYPNAQQLYENGVTTRRRPPPIR